LATTPLVNSNGGLVYITQLSSVMDCQSLKSMEGTAAAAAMNGLCITAASTHCDRAVRVGVT